MEFPEGRITGEEFDQARHELHHAIGSAVAGWSVLERALAEAFAATLGVPLVRVRGILFSARSFNGKHDMLLRAIQAAPRDDPCDDLRLMIFRSACKRADKFASVRNQLAHDQPCVTTLGKTLLSGTLIANHEGPEGHDIDRILTTATISEARESFVCLAKIIKEACAEIYQPSLEKLLRQVRQLSKCPYSGSVGIRAIASRERQRRAAQE